MENHQLEITDLDLDSLRSFQLVDIREVQEVQEDPFTFSSYLHAPLSTFSPPCFPKEEKILFFCKSGKRSLYLVNELKKLGFHNVFSLNKGKEALDSLFKKNQKEIVEFYDAFADHYEKEVLEGKDYTAFEKIPFWILQELKEVSQVLDLGCGTGLGSAPFMKAGHQVIGIDISPKMIDSAKKLPYHTLICQSLEEPLPFVEASFAAVQLLGVMEFIHHPLQLFKEVARVLKPQGFFGLTVPQKLSRELERELGILTTSSLEIENLFHELGFSILKKEEFQGFQYLNRSVHYSGYLVFK